MRRSYGVGYLVLAVLVLAPLGVRLLTRASPPRHAQDDSMAQAGKELFEHEWKPHDPLSPGGDGLGPVFNASSCVACHHQGGPGGSGGLAHNVTVFSVGVGTATRQGVVHARAVSPAFQETLALVHPDLPRIAQPALSMLLALPGNSAGVLMAPAGVRLSQRNTPALFGAKLIDEIPDRVLIAAERAQRVRWGMAPVGSEKLPVGRAARLAEGRVGKFGWKAQSASLADFVRAACANELGLGNPGQAQPRPMGQPGYQTPGLDLTDRQCDELTAFVAALPRPRESVPAGPEGEQARAGKRLFRQVGCADCHTPDLGGVEGLYSDLLLHRMGRPLEGGGSYYGQPPPPAPSDPSPGGGPSSDEWRTPPLWGVADSAPYLHDGRARTLEEAIQLHAGQAASSAARFARLSTAQQAQLIAFLKTLRAP